LPPSRSSPILRDSEPPPRDAGVCTDRSKKRRWPPPPLHATRVSAPHRHGHGGDATLWPSSCFHLPPISPGGGGGMQLKGGRARQGHQVGLTAIGLKRKDGVVLAVEKRVTSQLLEPSSVEKIMEIDEHIG
ncbi:unnamed protein product, partial [Urochloa humidicola]